MEVKFTVAGPAIGGAKSGINFDPKDPRKKEVLKRWFTAVSPLLKTYYGTGGDLNVDEIHEVIPMTEDCGVWHPQEGVFNGHFKPNDTQKINRIGQLQRGVSKILADEKYSPKVDNNYVVADMITGYGVASSIEHYFTLWGGDLIGKRVLVQGWGNVGSAAAYYLAQKGALIVGIIDRVGGIISTEGLSFEEVRALFINKNGNELAAPNMLSYEATNQAFWSTPADIFIPCAGSRMINEEQLEQLLKAGVIVISSGANVPFADQEIFFGPIAEKADANLALIPDFIANCGMARVFAYLMSSDLTSLDDALIFEDASQTIYNALQKTHAIHPGKTGIAKAAFEIALKQLV
jgi:glutamate dehydrogenase/leucine dehydrogenase